MRRPGRLALAAGPTWADWDIGGEVHLVPVHTEDGHATHLAAPALYADRDDCTRLVGGTHRGSLRRTSLRQARYAESIRQMVFQPDLRGAARAASMHQALETLDIERDALGAIDVFMKTAPALVSKRYVRGGTPAADQHNAWAHSMRRVKQHASGKTHAGRGSGTGCRRPV